MPLEPQEPWVSFLRALDARLSSPVELHCIGGFAMTMAYGVSRNTSDIDFLVTDRNAGFVEVQDLGGLNTELHRRYKVYAQPVAVAMYPEDYESRRVSMWGTLGLKNLRLFTLEVHDLALTKLDRNQEVDRQDVQALAAKGLLDPAALRRRYLAEFRPNLSVAPEKHDLTMDLWENMIREVQARVRRESPSP